MFRPSTCPGNRNRYTSYKYALLHAIADLCLVKGDDSGAELELSIAEIAEQFVRLYWPQVAPFGVGGHGKVLRQNRGHYEAVIVSKLARYHEQYQGSLPRLRQARADWAPLLQLVEEKVKNMPLWKLQNVGPKGSNVLYEKSDAGTGVRLKPRVAYSFRAFRPTLIDQIQGEWSQFVSQLNQNVLDPHVDLRSFLFPSRLS